MAMSGDATLSLYELEYALIAYVGRVLL